MSTETHKPYTVVPFPWIRGPIIDTLQIARRKPVIHALVEIDVTIPRQYLSEHKRATGESLSFTAFIIACMAKALREHKEVQAYRQGRRRLILFEDVDVCTLVEHDADGGKIATPFVIRAANCKTVRGIHREIRAAQATGVGSPWAMRLRRLYPYVPRLLRMAFWRAFERYPRLRKRIGGTVVVSAVGMFGTGAGWGIPITDYTLAITLGGHRREAWGGRRAHRGAASALHDGQRGSHHRGWGAAGTVPSARADTDRERRRAWVRDLRGRRHAVKPHGMRIPTSQFRCCFPVPKLPTDLAMKN